MKRGRLAPTAAATVLCIAACGTGTRSIETKTQRQTTTASPAGSASVGAPVMRVLDASFHVVARVPAFDAEASRGGAGERVFAFDPEVRTLRGLDLATGKVLWSTPLGETPSGRVKMYPSYGAAERVLVHIQDQLLLFDAQTGSLVSQSGGPWSQEKMWLSIERGACVFGTDCELHLVDCEDAHPYGPVLRSAVTHLYKKLGEPHDNVCWGPRLLVGRGGDVVVAVTDGRTFELPDTAPQEGPITVGIDAKTGKTVWSTRTLGCQYCAASGVSSDGATCWLADSAGVIDVFACATGKHHFRKTLPATALAPSMPNLFTTWVAGALLLSTATEVVLLEPKSGKTLWSTPLPPKALGLPLGTRLELDRYSTWDARTVLLVDPKSGKEVTRFELPAYVELLQSPDLGLRVKGGPAFDEKGTKRAFVEERPLFSLERERAPKLLRTGDGSKTLAEVTTDLAIVAARRTEQADELALFVWGSAGHSGELVFARLDRAKP